MNIKKCVWLVFIASALHHHGSSADEHIPLSRLEDFDDESINIFDDFNTHVNDSIIASHLSRAPAAATTPPDVIISILQEFGIINLLEQNTYLRTNVFNSRDVLDLPCFIKDMSYDYPCGIIGMQFFYDQTTQEFFSPHHDTIDHYLAIGQASFIEAISNAFSKIGILVPELTQFPIVELLDLFASTKVTERRTGGMFQWFKYVNDTKFSLNVPLYYRERNYFLTDQELDLLELLTEPTTHESKEQFQKDHLVSDRLGLGNTRFMIDVPCFATQHYSSRIGGFVTIPTGWTWADSIYGSTFKNKNLLQPTVSFTELIDLLQTDPALAQNMATNFFLGALDRLSAILLDTGLGNNGHLGMAVYYRGQMPLSLFIKRPWASHIELKSNISLEYLFPKTEKRYFVPKNLEQEFNTRNFNNPNQAADNLAFLEEVFVNKVYPRVLNTMVHPGLIGIWTSKATYENSSVAVHVGTDTWIQTPERFGSIDASAALISTLNVKKAQRFYAYQSTFFASAHFKIHRYQDDVLIGLHFAQVFSSIGIGSEFTLGLTIEKNF